MGQTSSTMSFPDDRRRRSFRRRLSFQSPIKRHRAPHLSISRTSRTLNGVGLSEAFNMTSDDFRVDFVNINEATEEQLMTLPGIGRRTARDIVGYRQAIGQFRKVEDLAIVSGVGAAKLATIRSEISVTSRRGPRTAAESVPLGLVRSRLTMGSSKTGSGMVSGVNGSLPALSVTAGNVSSVNPDVVCPVDLNTASMFQLMSVRGISQEMAANIVHHREKKGRFQAVEDLSKVKGFNGRIIGEYKASLMVSRDPINDGGKNLLTRNAGCLPRRLMSHRRSSSVPVFSSDLHSETTAPTKTCGLAWEPGREEEDVDQHKTDDVDSSISVDVYEALAARSFRPPIVERFSFRRDSKPALRLATWNLDRFDESKSKNLGVIEVICLTILESGVSLVAVQEFSSRQVLSKICQELNQPTLKKVKEWVGPFGTWKCLTTSDLDTESKESSEHLGFLFDVSRGIEVLKSESLCKDGLRGAPRRSSLAFLATFKMDTFIICLLCVHFGHLLNKDAQIKGENAVNGSIASVFRSWKQSKDSLFIVLGDFKHEPTSKELKVLKANHFTNLMPTLKDNIWISASVKKYFTGHCEAMKNGLSHMAIPKGRWGLGGSASSYFPVWAEFYVPSSASSPNIAVTSIEETATLSHLVFQSNGDLKGNSNNNFALNNCNNK